MLNNLKNLFEEIKNGNNLGEEITLVGAIKTVSADTVNLAIENGLKVVAENKVQEFMQKYDDYPSNAILHFIGHLQTNKVKYIVGKVSLIHSIDSEKLLFAVNDRAKSLNLVQSVLLEVNIANDENKHGFNKQDLFKAISSLIFK